ncbi:MAG: 3-dehydroquinate synthase [Acidobacteria bacterium]|nr:MAG: 3-dehydroquinate synthase [Acidobacteriota bacterium]
MQRVQVRLPARKQEYEIKIDADLLSELGRSARVCLGEGPRRTAVISNKTVFDLYGERAVKSLRSSGFKIAHWLMNEGEQHKSLRSLEKALFFLSDAGLERGDAIVALGGGVVGDIAGFAAAVYLRGIAFIQVPTTLLAQIDASVGGKTGVNMPAGKNLVGAFHQPKLVLIDTETLRTLPRRELTSGWCEAVKQGAAGDRRLFDQTVRLLRRRSVDSSLRRDQNESQTEICATIAAHCQFKASIVAGDEREDISRDDHRSRRILNFGHTIAHALESVTGYRRFRHGEAVGYGMLVAGEISKSLGMLAPNELELLREAVRLCGPLPRADDLAAEEISAAIKLDKKSVSGIIKWVLLERIGRARIVSGNEIDKRVIRSSMRAGLKPLR